MSTAPTVTPQQQQAAQQHVLAELNKAQARILPAKLADIPSNGLHVSAYITQHGLLPNAENFYIAIRALVDTLVWDVEPASLKARKVNELGLEVLPNALKDVDDFMKRKTAAEAAEKKRIEDEKTFERIDLAIAAFSPRRLSTKIDEQAKLRAHVAREKARNAVPEGVFEVVRAYIEKFYADEQRKLERV